LPNSSVQLTSSPVFRDAQSFQAQSTQDGLKYTVTLLDATYETAAVFQCFLDIHIKGEFNDICAGQESSEKSTAKTCHNLYQFMTKWQCTAGLNFLVHAMYKRLHHGGLRILVAFVTGAFMGNVELCTTALRRADEAWRRLENTDSILQPEKWPTWAWALCPPSYLAALAQASKRINEWNFFTLSDEFEKRLDKFDY
jgi:hypothetical protein